MPSAASERREAWGKTDETDSIILSCRLKSGAFESSIEVPLTATKEEMDDFAASWLKLMETGVKIGQSKR